MWWLCANPANPADGDPRRSPTQPQFAGLRFPWVVGLVLVAALGAALNSRAEPDAQKDAEEARRSLRQQGFKTDLSDFDFSTDAQTAARSAALTNFLSARPILLLQPCGTESAIVAWKQTRIEDEEEGYQNLPPVEQWLTTNQAPLDAACAAALAGPIRFPLAAKDGGSMLLIHLAPLKSLSQAMAARSLVELRQQRFGPAWTNLLALTRLATAWEPEPLEISHLVRFNLARTASQAAWQALQAHHWTEDQLISLQREWESPDFFKGIPGTLAFQRATTVDSVIRDRTTPQPGIPLKDTLENALRSPTSIPAEVKYHLDRAQYRAVGSYEDEHDLLLFYRDRELELRKAITASSWQKMRALPGVTNSISFQSKHRSSIQSLLNTRQLALRFQLQGKSLLGRAAETEARRRLVLAAIALERHRLARGSYPKDLAALMPDFLKSVPIDFMDGQPLRYRLGKSGGFVLYSVGLDCIDAGGKFSTANEVPRQYPRQDPSEGPDLIWPRAASEPETLAFQRYQNQARQAQKENLERQEAKREREAEEQRQEIIKELGRIYARGAPPKITDPKIDGKLLSQVLRNKAVAGPPVSLDQMLTLRQVITGEEPDIATFELPISYNALTNLGTLELLCDADPGEDSSSEAAELQECAPATNGNCRLVWNTTYDPPGKHFLQARLSLDNWRARSGRRNRDTEEITLKGPLFQFVSTNVIQFFPLADVYSEKGAFFHVKLAQPVGSYSLKITAPSGEHIQTFTGSTTNGIVELHWDLLYGGGKRYTNDSFNSTWTVTFPDPSPPPGEKTP